MKGTPLTDELVDYINRLFPIEDDLLRALRADAERAGIPSIAISQEQGAFMQVLLRAIGARRVIEIGTLAGYSAIVMARALPDDGHLSTLEIDPMHAEFARERIDRAGLSRKVTVHVGAGLDLLERDLAASGPYDFAFIDADKQSYTRYLELLVPMMRRGGIVAGDNALKKGAVIDTSTSDETVRGIQRFNEALAADRRLQSCLVPIGDGIAMAVVL